MLSATTSKRISKNKRLELIKMWNDGKEDEVKKEGYHVIITKSGLTYLRKLKPEKEEKKIIEKKKEVVDGPAKKNKKMLMSKTIQDMVEKEDPDWLYKPTITPPKKNSKKKINNNQEDIYFENDKPNIL